VYVWDAMPGPDSDPRFEIEIAPPTRLSTDGEYLVVAPYPNAPIAVSRISELGSGAAPMSVGDATTFNGAWHVLVRNGSLFVADSAFNRVLCWYDIEDAIALGAGKTGRPAIGRNSLFRPAALAFDGSYLWVGEFKFSFHIVRSTVSGRSAYQESPESRTSCRGQTPDCVGLAG
jgi:hypothetical protein